LCPLRGLHLLCIMPPEESLGQSFQTQQPHKAHILPALSSRRGRGFGYHLLSVLSCPCRHPHTPTAQVPGRVSDKGKDNTHAAARDAHFQNSLLVGGAQGPAFPADLWLTQYCLDTSTHPRSPSPPPTLHPTHSSPVLPA
jgi:hypothetical protein